MLEFHEALKNSLSFMRRDKFLKGSGISESSLKEILKGRYPSANEFASIKRFFPHLKKHSSEIHENQKQRENMSNRTKNKSKEKSVQTSIKFSEPHVVSEPVSSQEIDKSDNLVIKTNMQKDPKEEQYTSIETVDPSLAKVLLEGNKKNRSLSSSLVDSIARDITSGNWIVSHQGIAIDKEGNLLDGQHRLNAIIKSGLTVRMAVTYNVSPEAFEVIDMNNRPRTVADMQGISRGIKNSRRVVAAAKTISALDTGYRDRYTNSEVDEILNKYQEECEWAATKLGGRNPSAGITAGFAYAYPTNKEKIEIIAQSFSSKVGMSKNMAALHKAAERIGRTSDERVDLAYLTMRAIRNELKGTESSVRSLYVQKDSGEGKAIAYRSFRALRAKLGIVE